MQADVGVHKEAAECIVISRTEYFLARAEQLPGDAHIPIELIIDAATDQAAVRFGFMAMEEDPQLVIANFEQIEPS